MCNVLDFLSRKSRHVVGSKMEAELYAITNVFDTVTLIITDLSRALGKRVPSRIFTNSKHMFFM